MRVAIGVMVGFYIVTFWVGPIIAPFLFSGGDVSETNLHPIYIGMILLSGLIVACTKIVLEKVAESAGKRMDE